MKDEMQQITQNANQILFTLGGYSNIVSATNCMTRLRITVKDEHLADDAKLKEYPFVLSVIHDRPDYYEVVVGPGKSVKYANACYALGVRKTAEVSDWKENKKALREGQNGNRIKVFLKSIGDIFVPLIPGIIAAGLCAGFASLISQIVPGYAENRFWSCVYQFLSLINTAFMTYITAWAGYRAADCFGATPVLGGMLGMITSLSGIDLISQNIGLYNADAPLASILRSGKGGVLAVIAGVYILSMVEKHLRKRMPESADIVLTPTLTLIICVVSYVLLLMPAFGWISSLIADMVEKICSGENIIIRMIAGFISSALFLPLVAAGMHHGLVALYAVQLQSFGMVTLYPALAMSGAGQVGAAMALAEKARKTGNNRLLSVINGAIPAGILGVGEPLIYGVTLPLGKPFLTAGLGAGFGGAIVMAARVASTTWGPSGALGTFVMTAGPDGAVHGILWYIAGLLISCGMGYLITRFSMKDEEIAPRQAEAQQAERNQPASPEAELFEESSGIFAPVFGQLIPKEEIPDKAFASGSMGETIGVIPSDGTVYAPCSGSIAYVADTKHSFGIVADDGTELLVHIGIDTVGLNGRCFECDLAEGQKIRKGERLMSFDIEKISEAGLSPIVIVIRVG